MKKSYKIEVDCANCANLMEEAAPQDHRRRKCDRQFHDPEDDRRVSPKLDAKQVMQDVLKACKKVEPDCEITWLRLKQRFFSASFQTE